MKVGTLLTLLEDPNCATSSQGPWQLRLVAARPQDLHAVLAGSID